jgi:hypothetical protein
MDNNSNDYEFLYKYLEVKDNGRLEYITQFLQHYFSNPVNNLIHIDGIYFNNKNKNKNLVSSFDTSNNNRNSISSFYTARNNTNSTASHKNIIKIKNRNYYRITNMNMIFDKCIIKFNTENQPFFDIYVNKNNGYIYIYINWNNDFKNEKKGNNVNKIKKLLKESDYYKKLFIYLYYKIIYDKSFIVIYKHIYNTIFEFLRHSYNDNYNSYLLNEFIKTGIWYKLLSEENQNNKQTLLKDTNISLKEYLLDIPYKYELINEYNIKISNDYINNQFQPEKKRDEIWLQVYKDFMRNNLIIFINDIIYSVNNNNNYVETLMSYNNYDNTSNFTNDNSFFYKDNDYLKFIYLMCHKKDINDDNVIRYIQNIILNYSQQGSQIDSALASLTGFVHSIFYTENLNCIFAFFEIEKEDDNNIKITINIAINYKIVNNNDKPTIGFGFVKILYKVIFDIKISGQNITGVGNKLVNLYLYLDDNIIIENKNNILNSLQEKKEINGGYNSIISYTNELIKEALERNNIKSIYKIYEKQSEIFRLIHYVKKFEYFLNSFSGDQFKTTIVKRLFELDKKKIKEYLFSFLLPIYKDTYEQEKVINDKIFKKDILIISYNEGKKSFKEENIYPIIFKIIIENPLMIAVCTQESGITTYKSTYQSVLRNYLEKNNYTVIEKLYGSQSSIKYTSYDKNVRTYIYIRNNLKSNKYTIDTSIFKSKKSGLGEINEKTLFKGSIFFELEINSYKCIIVNSHLFYKKNGNTGYLKREEQFLNLIDEFKLYDYYVKGYDIFFSGDLNFRLFGKTPNEIINNYLGMTKNNFKKKYINYNQLTRVLNKSFKQDYSRYLQNLDYNFNNILNPKDEELENKTKLSSEELRERIHRPLTKTINNTKFNPYKLLLIRQFKKSIEKIGYDLTCKYKESNDMKYNITKENFVVKPNNGFTRVPSMCDRILFAVHDDNMITPDDFSAYLFPKRSDHKLISLSFSSNLIHEKRPNKEKERKISNNNKTKENTGTLGYASTNNTIVRAIKEYKEITNNKKESKKSFLGRFGL